MFLNTWCFFKQKVNQKEGTLQYHIRGRNQSSLQSHIAVSPPSRKNILGVSNKQKLGQNATFCPDFC